MSKATTQPDNPPAGRILVLGMHRSGTSALARVLGLMGAWIGEADDLLPAHASDNPSGYWERTDVVNVHHEFLHEAGYAWDSLAGFDFDVVDVGLRKRLQAGIQRIVEAIEPQSRPLLLKDPRLCLLLPAWRAQLEKPACVIAVRDPREIAASIRQGPRGAYTSHFLLALWEKYMRGALAHLVGERVMFVSYERLVANPESEAERVLDGLRALGVTSLHAASPDALREFIDPNLRRSEPLSHMTLSPDQADLFAWLEQQCVADGPASVSGFPDGAPPDAVLAEYDKAFASNAERARQQALGDMSGRLAQVEAAVAHEQRRLLDELAQQRQHSDSLERERERLEREHERLNREIEQQTHALADREREQQRLQGDLAFVSTHASERAQAIEKFKRSLSWRITWPLRVILDLLLLRLPKALEQGLYKLYYAIPGLNEERKRNAILWIHAHHPWLSRHTLSYRLLQNERELSDMRAVPKRMDADRAKEFVAALTDPPLISIAMPVYNVEQAWLDAAVDSVRTQYYPHWELCIVDDGSTRPETLSALAKLEKDTDQRIRVQRLKRNEGIAGASNAALRMASGSHVGFLDNDDELTRDALIEMVRRIIVDDPDLIYSDEDKLNDQGEHFEPHFKPDFSPDLL
ncbi:MAG: glycosyltransferase, partial [Rhodanobacteraceae bacterium]